MIPSVYLAAAFGLYYLLSYILFHLSPYETEHKAIKEKYYVLMMVLTVLILAGFVAVIVFTKSFRISYIFAAYMVRWIAISVLEKKDNISPAIIKHSVFSAAYSCVAFILGFFFIVDSISLSYLLR